MKAPPPLTIGIPFLDEETSLAAAVRSILCQSMSDFELLLVDDGSRDRSLEIARSFRDPRVMVHSDGRHLGLAARLNEITQRARSELVARMDGDDVSHPTRVARQLEVLASSGADAVGTWAGIFDDADRCRPPFAVIEVRPLPSTNRAAAALRRGTLIHASMMARRGWMLAHPYDEGLSFAEDRDLWVRTASDSTFAVVPEPLYAIRIALAGSFERDYARAQRINRSLFLRHGPRALGLSGTAGLWLASHAKTAITRVACRAGQGERLVRRRGRPPTPSEVRTIREALDAAHSP
jgi:glycosyltransferase involved in cell wall biosynthesis